jgi:acetolactate synthase-1/3 small subunit
VALYRVSVNTPEKRAQINEIVMMTKASVIHVSKGEVTITHMGTEEETENLKSLLQPFGLKEFVRSGRIAVTKKEHALSGKWALEMDT